MVQGVISRVFDKDFGDGPTYSIKLQGDETFYRVGKKLYFKQGDAVEFDTNIKNNNTYANNLRPWVEGPTSTAAPVSEVAKSATAAKSDYQATQARIELQSCRNSALELVKLVLQVDGVTIPTKKPDREAVVVEMVNHYTQMYLDQNAAGKPSNATPEVSVESSEDPNKKDWK